MSESACGVNGQIMILSCSGGSNVGQLSNQAAVELTKEGFGKMFCLAGVGAHLSGFVKSAKDVPTLIAIDGCSVGCTKAILDHSQIPVKNHVVITDLGIEKNKDLNLKELEINEVKKAVKQVYAKDAASKIPHPNMIGAGCCCSGKC
ncbi:MAG: putative zinc-binding protein [Desulfamplus sp.]|nr:putative zinc-binding protein [Desulfamplus sp.]